MKNFILFFNKIGSWFRNIDGDSVVYWLRVFGTIIIVGMFFYFGINMFIQASHVPNDTTVLVIRVLSVFIILVGVFLGVSVFPKKGRSSDCYKCHL